MKAYIVTLMRLPESVTMAERCKKSAEMFNIQAELFPAVHGAIALIEAKKEQLKISTFDTSFSNLDAVIGNFVTQYRIWKTIINSKEPGIVLEHDAVFTDGIPNVVTSGDIVNIGKPSYGAFNTKDTAGIFSLFSKSGGYFPGCHGYFLTPLGASLLVNAAHQLGVAPCDMFVNNKNFSDLKEIYPWVVEARDTFTTIQKEKGCAAKHNFNKYYKII